MLHDLGLRVFAPCAAYVPAFGMAQVHACMHNEIDGCDTEKLVFLDNNLIFRCAQPPRALSASICIDFSLDCFFSLFSFSRPAFLLFSLLSCSVPDR